MAQLAGQDVVSGRASTLASAVGRAGAAIEESLHGEPDRLGRGSLIRRCVLLDLRTELGRHAHDDLRRQHLRPATHGRGRMTAFGMWSPRVLAVSNSGRECSSV